MSESDIVERLHERAKSLRGMGSIAHADADIDDAAADTITALRARVETLEADLANSRAICMEEAARCAENYERVVLEDPPMRVVIDGIKHEIPGAKIVDRTGCDDIAAAIRALAKG